MTWSSISDPTNSFEKNGLSWEDKALLDFLVAARQHTGIGVFATSTTDHPDTGTTRHLKQGTGGQGLAIDYRLSRSSAPHFHVSAFMLFWPLRAQIHELIYAYPPAGTFNIKAGKKYNYSASVINGHKDHIHISVDKGVFLHYAAPEVKPMFDPPLNLPPIVAELAPPSGKGTWLLGANGDVFCWTGATDYGSPLRTHPDDWGNRKAARLEPNGDGYTVFATNGQSYDYP